MERFIPPTNDEQIESTSFATKTGNVMCIYGLQATDKQSAFYTCYDILAATCKLLNIPSERATLMTVIGLASGMNLRKLPGTHPKLQLNPGGPNDPFPDSCWVEGPYDDGDNPLMPIFDYLNNLNEQLPKQDSIMWREPPQPVEITGVGAYFTTTKVRDNYRSLTFVIAKDYLADGTTPSDKTYETADRLGPGDGIKYIQQHFINHQTNFSGAASRKMNREHEQPWYAEIRLRTYDPQIIAAYTRPNPLITNAPHLQGADRLAQNFQWGQTNSKHVSTLTLRGTFNAPPRPLMGPFAIRLQGFHEGTPLNAVESMFFLQIIREAEKENEINATKIVGTVLGGEYWDVTGASVWEIPLWYIYLSHWSIYNFAIHKIKASSNTIGWLTSNTNSKSQELKPQLGDTSYSGEVINIEAAYGWKPKKRGTQNIKPFTINNTQEFITMQGQIDVLRETVDTSLEKYENMMNTSFRENRIQLTQFSSKMKITDAAAHLDRAIGDKRDAAHALERWEDKLYDNKFTNHLSQHTSLSYLLRLMDNDPKHAEYYQGKISSAQAVLDAALAAVNRKKQILEDTEDADNRLIESINHPAAPEISPRKNKRIRATDSAPALQRNATNPTPANQQNSMDSNGMTLVATHTSDSYKTAMELTCG
ncbi:hypothetical protein P7C70_g4843, partial [Phenoliferia sp. Uapishka_3]